MRAVRALTEALALRDSDTHVHSRRTVVYAAALAEELGLGSAHVEQIRVAALLHDVGKIGIPDSILRKPDPLTQTEWAVVRRHSATGSSIVAGIGLPETARWIHYLHERYDGNGYPAGLANSDIPFESRLLHAADALEAMTSERPYSNALTLEQATAALEECAGTQLDPQVALPLARLARDEDLCIERPPRIRLVRELSAAL
jgi:putative nucleotidyltransferase with HDIG domain